MAQYKNLTAQKAANWSQAQLNWLKQNDPKKLAYGKNLARSAGAVKQPGVNRGGGQLQMQPVGGRGGQSLASYRGGGGGGGGMGGNLLKAGAIGAGAGAASIAMGGLGSASPLMAFGPAGVAAGAGLLALGFLSNKKDKDYHEAGGFGKTGGGYKQVGQVDPNSINWKQYVNDPRNQDLKAAAKSYREGTASASDIGYWQRRASSVGAGDVTKMSDEQFAKLHFEFDAQGEGPRESEYRLRVAKPKAAPAPRRRAAPAPEAPAPVATPTRESVSKPASGLEDTIKVKPEEVKRTYLTPKKKKKAGFFSYGGEMT